MVNLAVAVLAVLLHVGVYIAGHQLAYDPSLIALARNVLFIAAFAFVAEWLARRYRLQRAGRHAISIALLLSSIGFAVQYRISYDVWASAEDATEAIANRRRFLREKINILFVQHRPEFRHEYRGPDSPHRSLDLRGEIAEMASTLGKMGLVLVAFAGAVILQARGRLEFLRAHYLALGALTLVLAFVLGGIAIAWGSALRGGTFIAQMTPWEIIKVPLVLAMSGFVIAAQPYLRGQRTIEGSRTRFIAVITLFFLSPLVIFFVIRDFGQLWILTIFYVIAFYASTRRIRYSALGLAVVVLTFIATLDFIPHIDGLALAIAVHRALWCVAPAGAALIFVGYAIYAARTRHGTRRKLALAVAGMFVWVFTTFTLPPSLITLFGAGESEPRLIARDFAGLSLRTRRVFLDHAPVLSERLAFVLNLHDDPDSIARGIVAIPRGEVERRIGAWRMADTFGGPNPPVRAMAGVLQTWPRDAVRGLLDASPRFAARLAIQLGTPAQAEPMADKIRRISRESLEDRLRFLGEYDPTMSLGILATPMRRITSWWRLWGVLTGTEKAAIYDEEGPYWRTLDHLFRGFFAMESGGWVGRGIGMGYPTFVPKAINDFIYVALGEELGWIGSTLVLLLYLALAWTMIAVGQRAETAYWRLVALNFAVLVWAQAFVNVGGVTGLLPLTGIPLPFVSRGFFSVLTSFIALGLVAGIRAKPEEPDRESAVVPGGRSANARS